MSGQTTLKPHDVVVVCQIAMEPNDAWTYETISQKLRLSTAEICNVIKRADRAGLLTKRPRRDGQRTTVDKAHLFDFIVHGVPTAFFPQRTEVVKGVPTATYSPLYRGRFQTESGIPVVWPYSKGKETGEGLIPLFPAAPLVCPQHDVLYNLLSSIDVLRIGRQREKDAAVTAIAGILQVDPRTETGSI
jgi:hypothetical protein